MGSWGHGVMGSWGQSIFWLMMTLKKYPSKCYSDPKFINLNFLTPNFPATCYNTDIQKLKETSE